jgi:hypothetical protein
MTTPSDGYKADLLRAAAVLLESRQPDASAVLSYWCERGINLRNHLVRFSFPGVISVYLHATGELVVQSRPGRPTQPKRSRIGRTREVRI